jgi:class 3 adenylate cyclase/pimeloyl-ACP methyl ester carboxylesterase
MARKPETRYAKSGDTHIAYQLTGSAPLDLVLVPGFISHLELGWEEPRSARYLERLSSFCRLIRFDKRGTGLSDRGGPLPTLEERMDDVRAVMDAVGSQRAAVCGFSEGAAMSILFSATYPQRTSALVLIGGCARYAWAPDYTWGRTDEQLAASLKFVDEKWGRGETVAALAPSLTANDEYRRWMATCERAGASPGAVQALHKMNQDIDVRHVLSTVAVPTLVMHRLGDRAVNVEHGRFLAAHIPNAQYVECPGEDHHPWAGDTGSICDEIQTFLTGVRGTHEADRVLATVLFTDIVGATQHAAQLGDRAWKDLLGQHHYLVRQELERHRGREIDTAGDGFFAAFDGPARAVRCARGIAEAVKGLNIQVRAGVHTGECEVMGEKLGGIAVHIGARMTALALAGEVLVSSTVKDLVAGSGLHFENRGVHVLKGVPGEWNLFAAVGSGAR